jgi:hypothetical protein
MTPVFSGAILPADAVPEESNFLTTSTTISENRGIGRKPS